MTGQHGAPGRPEAVGSLLLGQLIAAGARVGLSRDQELICENVPAAMIPKLREHRNAVVAALQAKAAGRLVPDDGVEAGMASLQRVILLHGEAWPALAEFAAVFARVVEKNLRDPEFRAAWVKPTEEAVLRGAELRDYLIRVLDVRTIKLADADNPLTTPIGDSKSETNGTNMFSGACLPGLETNSVRP